MRTTLLAALLAATPAAAADADAARPYRWRVVVRFDAHPLFTPDYRGRVVKEVAAALAPVVQGVGSVEVAESPPADDAFARMLKETGFAAFDAPQFRDQSGTRPRFPLSPAKTHLLRVSAAPGGGVDLAARQLDGTSGLATPAVRTARARGFDTAGREAGLLVGREFGPAGTVEFDPAKPDEATVRFQGGSLPGFDRLVQSGDVLAVSLVLRGKDGPIGQRFDGTLLKVEGPARAGAAKCRVLTRFARPFPVGPAVAGLRCVKLATTESRIEVRVVDPAGNPPPTGTLIQVRASDVDFIPWAKSDGRDRLEFRNGVFVAPRPLRGVACVVVSVGTVGEERFPVPVTGGPVVIKYEADAAKQRLATVERARDELRGRVAEARDAGASLTRELSRLIDAGKNPEALDRATKGLEALAAADAALGRELDAFKKLAGPDKAGADAAEQLAQDVAGLGSIRPGIEARVADLRNAISQSNDPARLEKEFQRKDLLGRIRTALDAGEVPEALALYDRLVDLTKDPKIAEQKAKVEDEWKPRSPEHAKARDYALTEFRKVESLGDFPAAAEKLAAAAKVMAAAEDRYGLRGLIVAVDAAYGRLKAISDALTPDDQAQLKVVRDLFEKLREVQLNATGKVAALEGKAKP